MRKGLLAVIGVAGLIMAVIALLKLTPVSVAAQAPRATARAAANTGPASKTPWGEPDLQGIWTDQYQTPLQRPAQYANKEFFTDQERADLDRQRAGILRRDQRVQRGSERDVAGEIGRASCRERV